MVRHIHIDVIRARAAEIAENLGKPGEQLLIAEKLAETHAGLGFRVIRPVSDVALVKRYTPAAGLTSVTLGRIPVQHFNEPAWMNNYDDFQPTTQLGA